MKSGNLNFLEPSGPLKACNGTVLPLPLLLVIAFLFGLTVSQQFIFSVHKSSTDSVYKNKKKKKNVCLSASAVVLLCQYLAIVIHREEMQRDDSSVCILGSVIAIYILWL